MGILWFPEGNLMVRSLVVVVVVIIVVVFYVRFVTIVVLVRFDYLCPLQLEQDALLSVKLGPKQRLLNPHCLEYLHYVDFPVVSGDAITIELELFAVVSLTETAEEYSRCQ